MQIKDIEALLWVVRHGSLQAASRAESVSRTTLRRRLDSLEEAVGAPVVELHSSRVVLTTAGRVLLEEGPELIAHRAGLLKRAQEALSEPQGILKIVVGVGFPPALIAQLLSLCVKTYPGIQLRCRVVEDPLAPTDEDFDLAVFWGDEAPAREGYVQVFLRPKLQVMASPAYLAERGTPTTLAELADHTIIQRSDEPPAWPLLSGQMVPVNASHRINDLYTLGCMVGAGIGLGLMPARGVGVHPLMENLQPVLVDQIGTRRTARSFAAVRTSHGGLAATIVQRLAEVSQMIMAMEEHD